MKVVSTLVLLWALSCAAHALAACNLTPSAPRAQLMSCQIQLPQTVGGVVTRTYGVFVPTNYVPGQSFLIMKISGTTHKIAGDCPLAPAAPESAGWLEFLQTVPAPAPVMLCPQGWMNTGTTNNGERWRMWGWETAPYNGTWVTNSLGQPVVPDDQGFLDAIIPLVITGLQLQPQIAVTNDWHMSSIVASEFTARRPDLVSVLALYNDATFANLTPGPNGTMIDSDGSLIPAPAGPVNVILVESYLPKTFYASMLASMCGSSSRLFTLDDEYNYWASVVQPTTVVNDDRTGANTLFCTTTPNGYGGYKPTTLEARLAFGGVNGTEIQIYKAVGNSYATPPCSYNYQGVADPNMCGTNHPPANYNFTDPAATCTTTWPCNHFMPEPTLLQLFYGFMQSHLI